MPGSLSVVLVTRAADGKERGRKDGGEREEWGRSVGGRKGTKDSPKSFFRLSQWPCRPFRCSPPRGSSHLPWRPIETHQVGGPLATAGSARTHLTTAHCWRHAGPSRGRTRLEKGREDAAWRRQQPEKRKREKGAQENKTLTKRKRRRAIVPPRGREPRPTG